jgi:hypothetical protein
MFTRMVDMALVTAWLLYRHAHGTDILDLLDFKRAVAMPVSHSALAESMQDDRLSFIVC